MGGALINVDAALRPPHLKAIIPWEGVSDLYREFAFHGGIPGLGFVPTWWRKRMMSGRNKHFDFAEDFLAEIARHRPWPGRGEISGLAASSAHQPRQAFDPLRRAFRFAPPHAADTRRDRLFSSVRSGFVRRLMPMHHWVARVCGRRQAPRSARLPVRS